MIPYKITHDAKKDPMIKKASLFFSTEPSEMIEYRNIGQLLTILDNKYFLDFKLYFSICELVEDIVEC